MNTTTKSEAEAVAEIATKNAPPQVIGIEAGDETRVSVLLVPKGMDAVSAVPFLEAQRVMPERIKGTAELSELASFIAHVNRCKDECSAIFADVDPTAPKLIAVYDYNRNNHNIARWLEHRAEYPFPLSPEWKEWNARNGSEMTQEAFAAFVEGRIAEIGNPDVLLESTKPIVEKLVRLGLQPVPADALMALARGLQVRVGQLVVNTANLQSGEAELTFKEEHKDLNGQPLKVPNAFLVEIPVFRGGGTYQIVARLRYRVRNQHVTYWYELYRPELRFETAVREAAAAAQKGTELPLYFGTPEEEA